MTDILNIETIDNSPLLKPIKEKKPRSEKQLMSFITCKERLKERHVKQLNEKKIAAAKLLLDNDINHKSLEPIKEIVIEKVESSDEEIIYLKREKDKSIKTPKTFKKKPKVKTIILSSSESENETESESEPEPEIIPIVEKKFISQQNKKSLIKIHKPEPIKKNYFAD
jgi:hypothetical protein